MTSVDSRSPVQLPGTPASSGPAVRRRPNTWRADLAVAAAALGAAVFVTHHLIADPYHRTLARNVLDHPQLEWMLAYGVAITKGADPYFTTLLNHPYGVNLGLNTSTPVLAVLLSPLTALAGPEVTFVVILTLNLAGTAFGWYLFLRRWVVASPVAAAVGGLFGGFAPGLLSHANAHLNWSAGWIAPLLLWRVLKLREPGRWRRNGLILGVLVPVCYATASEGLFFVALASGVFLAVWGLARATRAEARSALPTVLAALGVAAAVAAALLAYPLHVMFAGPQRFTGIGFDQQKYAEDAAAFLTYSPRTSFAGHLGYGKVLAANPTEENSHFGLALVVLVVVALAGLWWRAEPGRRATLRALAVVGVLFALLSMGPRLAVDRQVTSIRLPFTLLQGLPLFDSTIPGRMALVVVGVFGIVLALTVDAGLRQRALTGRVAAAVAVALPLVPLLPQPLAVRYRPAVPAFITTGAWQQYVPAGGGLAVLPVSTYWLDAQRWQSYTLAHGGRQFSVPGGYFQGPRPAGPAAPSQVGPTEPPTEKIISRAADHGEAHTFTAAERARARADFQLWNANILVLPDHYTQTNHRPDRAALVATVSDLLGPPQRVDDVLLWRVRPGLDPTAARRAVPPPPPVRRPAASPS